MFPDLWREIGYSPFIVGFLYANLLGAFLIHFVMTEMRRLVGSEPTEQYRWQPHVTGIIERTMYMVSFFLKRPEFVLGWLVLKAAGGWEVWKTGMTTDGGKSDPHQGRAMYSNMFNGSALSILYAGVGFLFIFWWRDLELVISLAGILVVLTVLLWRVLKMRDRKTSEQN
jgi:hypothetical protein